MKIEIKGLDDVMKKLDEIKQAGEAISKKFSGTVEEIKNEIDELLKPWIHNPTVKEMADKLKKRTAEETSTK